MVSLSNTFSSNRAERRQGGETRTDHAGRSQNRTPPSIYFSSLTLRTTPKRGRFQCNHPPGRSSTGLSIAERAHDAMDGLLPEMSSRRPPEHHRKVRNRERVLDHISPGDADLQRG